MKSRTMNVILLVIIAILLAVVVFIVGSSNVNKRIKTSAIPSAAQLVVKKSAVGGLQEQPRYSLYDDGQMYMEYQGRIHSMELPRSSYRMLERMSGNGTHAFDRLTSKDGLITSNLLGNCQAIVDGVDVTWTYRSEDGSEATVDCTHPIDSQHIVIKEFNFFARVLWMEVEARSEKRL
ncbi:MAG TPA: hypothetical protein QF873_00160 [Patescibacteria group bacterium]|nr:hypothetical protein [Patescibacteria group bacterium]